MKGLMVCHRIRLPYRVMRCMAEAGVEIHILGGVLSKGLRFSRSCASFTLANLRYDGTIRDGMAEEVQNLCDARQIDFVFPGCALASRSLYGIKPKLSTPMFPGPDLQLFDLLNDKWEFTQTCGRMGIRCPASWRYEEVWELRGDIEAGIVPLPAICKPLSSDGERDIAVVRSETLGADLKKVTQDPFIVQEFIEGEDIGASIYCKGGTIVYFLVHRLKGGEYETFESDEVWEALSKFAAHFSLDGVYNFDMRRNEAGEIFFLECNPRFFFKMPYSLAAGMNFVEPGLPNWPASTNLRSAGVTLTHTPKYWPKFLIQPSSISGPDRKVAGMLFGDPVSFARELAHLDWD